MLPCPALMPVFQTHVMRRPVPCNLHREAMRVLCARRSWSDKLFCVQVELSCCLVRRLAARSRKAADACAAVSFFSTAVLTVAAQLIKPQRAEVSIPESTQS